MKKFKKALHKAILRVMSKSGSSRKRAKPIPAKYAISK